MTLLNDVADTLDGLKADLMLNVPGLPMSIVDGVFDTNRAPDAYDHHGHCSALRLLREWLIGAPIEITLALFKFTAYENAVRSQHGKAYANAGVSNPIGWLHDMVIDLSAIGDDAAVGRQDNSANVTMLRYLAVLRNNRPNDDPNDLGYGDVVVSFVRHLRPNDLAPDLRRVLMVVEPLLEASPTYRALMNSLVMVLLKDYCHQRAMVAGEERRAA